VTEAGRDSRLLWNRSCLSRRNQKPQGLQPYGAGYALGTAARAIELAARRHSHL
jgi:hypothetical protein